MTFKIVRIFIYVVVGECGVGECGVGECGGVCVGVCVGVVGKCGGVFNSVGGFH